MGHPNGGEMFSGGCQKSGKDAQVASHVIMKLGAVHQAGPVLLHGAPLALTSADSQQTNRAGAFALCSVDLYPFGAREQTGKCKFWLLPLWALTSWDSFRPGPHPGSDFPTSALIY